MNPRPRFTTFSLMLLTACSLCPTDGRISDAPLAQSLTAHNLEGLPQAAPPGQTASPQSPANEIGPLFRVVQDGKWGYIDETGKVVISLQYSDAYPFYDGLAGVQPGERQYDGGMEFVRLGFIDKTGQMVIPPQYPHIGAFSEVPGFYEGLFEVRIGRGKVGFVDKTGQMVIPQQYDMAYRFTEGLAAVKTGGKWGYIDKAGQMIIPSHYDMTYAFSEGLARVRVGDTMGYIDKTGKYVWAPTK